MRRCYALVPVVCLSFVAAFQAAPVRAAILYVKADAPGPAHDGKGWETAFLAIQQGLEAAAPGDSVWVAAGRYPEHVVFPRERISLYGGFRGTETDLSQRTDGAPSIIEADDPEQAAVMVPAGAAGTVLDGFTVTRGAAGPAPGVRCEATDVLIAGNTIRGHGILGGYGSGILCLSGSIIIRDNLIEGNTAREGGGIYAGIVTLTIERNVIRNNTAADVLSGHPNFATIGHGGGIFAERCTSLIRNNVITGNTAWDGGGLLLTGTATVTNNVIDGNTVDKPAPAWPGEAIESRAGGLYAFGLEGDVRNNLITNNRALGSTVASGTARAYGGGAVLQIGALNFVNNTVAGNVAHASDGKAYGAGVVAPDGVVANNIIAYNTADTGPEFHLGSTYWTNLFFRNLPSDAPNLVRNGLDAYGDTYGDPQFTSDYHLGPGSAAIDAGEISFVPTGSVDMDGEPRIRGRRADCGADEVQTLPGPSRIYVAPTGDDSNDGTTWITARRTVSGGLRAVGLDGEVWVARGTYPARPFFWSRTRLYGGFSGDETDRSQRNTSAHPSVLDGEDAGPVVRISKQVHDVTVDGFTITDGKLRWESGAGIQSAGRNITISNNIIENNGTWDFGMVAFAAGGGLSATTGPITISNNVIRNNSASVSLDPVPIFVSQAYASGGAMYLGKAEVIVKDNLFVRDAAWAVGIGPIGASGSALYAYNITGTISGNTFVENTTPFSNDYYYRTGEAVYLSSCGSGLVFANNIIAFNEKGYTQERSDVAPHHNAFFANAKGNVTGIPDPTGMDGNITADPVFVNRSGGDYRLSVGSPCIDTGDNSVVRPGETDLDGKPRILGSRVDMGSYEAVSATALTLGHVAWALRVAAGLSELDPAALPVLDLLPEVSATRVDVRDAIAVLRALRRVRR